MLEQDASSPEPHNACPHKFGNILNMQKLSYDRNLMAVVQGVDMVNFEPFMDF